MFRILTVSGFLMMGLGLKAADFQGYLADWNCVEQMVKNGQEQTLKNNKNCSLQHKYKRRAYGLITDDKKYYRLDAVGNQRAQELLPKSPTRDNLKVIVTGDVNGDVITVKAMSIL